MSTNLMAKQLLLIAFIALVTLFFRLGALPLTGADEPRYARIAAEMHDSGAWVTPELQGRPWLEKPPLYYWLTKPFYALFTTPEIAARAAMALCALLTIIAVYFTGRVIWSPSAGLVSSLILGTTLGWAGFGRSATTDMPFTCCLTLALALLAVAVERPLGKKALLAYPFLGLAVLGKGPVAMILAVGIAAFFWLFNERGGAWRRWLPLRGLLIALAVALPWFWLAFRANGYAFIATFFINHNLARYVTDIHHHAQPFYYYLPVLLGLFFPWSGWLPVLWPPSWRGGWRNWRQWRSGPLFCLCWFLTPIVFFSLSGSKLPGYILPSLPPLALLLGARLDKIRNDNVTTRAARLPGLRAALWVQLFLAVVMAVAAPLFFQKDYGGNWPVGLAIAAAALFPALVAFIYGRQGNCAAAVAAAIAQGTLLIGVVAVLAFPVLGDYHSTRAIARQALAQRGEREPIVSYRFFHHTLAYYTDYRAETRLDDFSALRSLAEKYSSWLVVTKAAGLRELQSHPEITTRLLFRQGNFFLLRVKPASDIS